jgi:hypothetical protein
MPSGVVDGPCSVSKAKVIATSKVGSKFDDSMRKQEVRNGKPHMR